MIFLVRSPLLRIANTEVQATLPEEEQSGAILAKLFCVQNPRNASWLYWTSLITPGMERFKPEIFLPLKWTEWWLPHKS